MRRDNKTREQIQRIHKNAAKRRARTKATRARKAMFSPTKSYLQN